MNDILKEQDFTEQDFTLSDFCASGVCAVEVGQLIGVSHMVTGDVGKVGTAYSVNVRMIDVSTGQIINSDSRTVQGEVERLLESMDDLARSLTTANTAIAIIPFTLSQPGKVKITIYSLLGDKVLTLTNTEYGKGSFSVPWNGLDHTGKRIKKGVYMYTIESPNGKKTGIFKLSN